MQELNFGKLMRHYLRYLWVIAAAILLGAGVGLFYSKNILKPEFRSDSTVILEQHTNSSDSTLINNYTTLLKSRKVLEPIIAENASSMSYSDLYQNISIVNEKSTEIITISVIAPDPEMAQNINSSLIESLNLESLGLKRSESESPSVDQIITVIDEASFNPVATNIKTVQNVTVMAGGGAILAIVVLFILFDFRSHKIERAAPRFTNRRSKMVGAITVENTPQITVGEISKYEQKEREVQNSRIKMIKREATDILDVLENIGGVELHH